MAGINWSNIGTLLVVILGIACAAALIGPALQARKGNFGKTAGVVACLVVVAIAAALFVTGQWLSVGATFLAFFGIGNGSTAIDFTP